MVDNEFMRFIFKEEADPFVVQKVFDLAEKNNLLQVATTPFHAMFIAESPDKAKTNVNNFYKEVILVKGLRDSLVEWSWIEMKNEEITLRDMIKEGFFDDELIDLLNEVDEILKSIDDEEDSGNE